MNFTADYHGERLLAAGSRTRFAVSLRADVDLPAGACWALARRWPSDWGTPQWSDPTRDNHVQVRSSAATRLRWWNARLHAWHPFDHAMIVALGEALPAGASLELRFGDAAGGSTGFCVQTFLEEASPLSVRLLVAPQAQWVEIARPVVRIVGTVADRLVVTVPGRVAAGRPFPVHLRAEDAWGNPAVLRSPVRVAVVGRSGTAAPALVLPETGWCRTEVVIREPGVHRVEARTEGPDGAAGWHAVSNPVDVGAGEPAAVIGWGDLHAQSVIGCGARSIDDYYRHARDFAATDFSSHQANCFLVSGDEWQETQRSTRAMNEPGRFVTLLGVEWSAASRLGGDHNLYFAGDEAALRRCSHEFVANTSDVDLDLPHVDDLHAHYRGSQTLIAVHVGGRTADLQFHEPTLDRLLEVHSTHATSEWFLFEALKRGYRMGVVAGSDSVDGRPGASHPGRMGVRNVRGGLTAVELPAPTGPAPTGPALTGSAPASPALTRPALLAALKARHCYATTGERILLSLRAGDCRMGDEATVRFGPRDPLPAFEVAVDGTAPIESIDFFRDDALLQRHDALSAATRWSDRIRVAWRGASAPGNWQRARMQWDGGLRIAGAQILNAAPWAFDTPDEGITAVSADRVAWRSVTAGDWDGVVLTLDRPEQALLTFHSVPLSLQCRIGGLDGAGWTEEQQSPWRCVEIRRLPAEEPPLQCRLAFDDPLPLTGRHAYWVRVRQTDGAYAWSTPIFLDLAAA